MYVSEGIDGLLPLDENCELYIDYHYEDRDGTDYIEYPEQSYIVNLNTNLLVQVIKGELVEVPHTKLEEEVEDPIFNNIYHINNSNYRIVGELNNLQKVN